MRKYITSQVPLIYADISKINKSVQTNITLIFEAYRNAWTLDAGL